MGLLVPEFTMPNGNTVNNVYMSFHNAVIYTYPVKGQDYQIASMVRVYADADMSDDPIYEFPVEIPNSDLSKGPFVNMYTALKALFPRAVDYRN